MSRAQVLARLERERLAAAERRGRERLAASEVRAGVAETVALESGRGAAFAEPASERGPYRRLPGLAWLSARGRLRPEQVAAGERYGGLWRAAEAEPALRSTLDIRPGDTGGRSGVGTEVLALAERRAQARRRLEQLRDRLGRQPDLVSACDRICGQELTPREASRNDREAGKVEVILAVALDLLSAEARN